jgi:hypothetical protein
VVRTLIGDRGGMLTSDAPFRVEESQRREVGRLVAEGLLESLLPGVAGPAGSRFDPGVRVAAAALALPGRVRARGVVAQAAAAWVWCGGPSPEVIDVAVPPGRTVPRLPALVAHERRMPGDDVVVLTAAYGDVQVTTATRTLVDLLRLLPAAEAPWVVTPLVTVPGVTAEGVTACLERMPRARGVTRARTLAATLPLARAPGRG